MAAPKASLVHPRKELPRRAPERLPSAGEAALGSWAKRGMRGGAKSGQSALRITPASASFDPAFSATRVCWQGARDPTVAAVAAVMDVIPEAWRLGGTRVGRGGRMSQECTLKDSKNTSPPTHRVL